MITIVNLIPCSTISFFSLLMSMKGATLRRVAGMYAVLVAAFSFRMNADLCKSGYRGAFQWVKGCIRASGVFVLAAVSLPVPPLKADALTLPNRFFYPVLTFAGFGIPALASLRASQVCQPLLISSFISARGLPGKGVQRCPHGGGRGWDVPSNTSLLCQIGSSGVLLKSTRGNSLVIPTRLVWRLFRCSRLAIRSRVRFAASRP